MRGKLLSKCLGRGSSGIAFLNCTLHPKSSDLDKIELATRGGSSQEGGETIELGRKQHQALPQRATPGPVTSPRRADCR